MCGRFAFYSPAEAAAALFGVDDARDVEPHYNIAPTEYVASVRKRADGGRELVMLRWGLVPFWAKDPSIGNRMINARAETVAGKPAYRESYNKRRCLVLADGFYEWRKESHGKTPYFISRASGEPFAIAGLWELWKSKGGKGGKGGDDRIESATLVTTAANGFVAPLHDRMPVILGPEGADRWLAGDEHVLAEAADLCPPLRAWPVDRRVNNARNEGADLVEAAGPALPGG